MDEKKMVFITCVNDEAEYAECRYYLERLRIPEGYAVEMIKIQDALSMAAGYNAGMNSSDAKYKVYLHQDVFIRNQNFISEILEVFAQDEQIGILGMIGKRNLKMGSAEMVMIWDTGRVIDNEYIWSFGYPASGKRYAEVQASDGLLLATQYDIPWREDIFTGWDFYDISQCMEFQKSGFKVAVPVQEEIWCYHDTLYSKFTHYYDHYKCFLQEYAEMLEIDDLETLDSYTYEKEQECAQAIEELRAGVVDLFDMGDKSSLRTLLLESDLRKSIYLREYASIVSIDYQEETAGLRQRFWEPGRTAVQLVSKLRKLKYMLKRIEYAGDCSQKEQLRTEYSRYAVLDVCSRYVTDKERVLGKIADLLEVRSCVIQ
ncbi:MAG: hypothetical protein HFI18_15455 [Lachnospiraceae bacterium]|nr:hypothetical protein [Lachnospiraceae bacterium]